MLLLGQHLKFADEVEALQVQVDKLQTLGYNKIIALGHSGFHVDQDIAKRVRGVDVVIGGHTNTFLYTGIFILFYSIKVYKIFINFSCKSLCFLAFILRSDSSQLKTARPKSRSRLYCIMEVRNGAVLHSQNVSAGNPPSTEVPAGPYPFMVRSNDGRDVPVVQAFAFGKYLGYLKVTFDKAGNVIKAEGNPILMDSSIPQGRLQ